MESPELESLKLESLKEEPAKEIHADELPASQNVPSNKGISGKPSQQVRVGDEYQTQVPDPATAYHTQVKMAPGIPIIWDLHSSEDNHVPLPGMYQPSAWSESEKDMFLLGLFIYGKRLNLVRRFMEGDNKTMGDVLSYYYGSFYKTDWYKRYKMKHCVVGHRLFQGWRQDKILSCLTDSMPKESHDALKEIFKSYNEDRSSFEEFIIAVKGVAGSYSLVQAIGIGKGKHDLTKVRSDPNRGKNQGQTHLDMPVGKEWSLLSLEEVVRFLTGGYRLGKSRSNDLFWEAVWPRLLVKGWMSVQPNDHALTFLIPGIDIFPREDLIRGIHYFDSVTDLLSKVASDPILISVPNNGENELKNINGTSSSCPRPRLQHSELNLMKFTVVDTSIVEREGLPCKVRVLRSLPFDTYTTTHGILDKPGVDRSAPESSGTVDSATESTDLVKDELVELNLAEKNAFDDAKLKSNKRVYVHDVPSLSKKRRRGSSKIKTETYKNDQSNPPCTDELSLKTHLLEPESEKKVKTQAPPPSVDLNLPDLTSTSDENNEKQVANPNIIRRHGTRNRPPTAKALESLALGFLGATQRKDSEFKSCSSRPKRRGRKPVQTVLSGSHENVPMTACVSPYACSDDRIDRV